MKALIGDSDRVQNVCLCLLVVQLNGETEGTSQGNERSLWVLALDLDPADSPKSVHVVGVPLQRFDKVIARGIKLTLGFIQPGQIEMDLRIRGQGPGQVFIGLDGLVQIVYDAGVVGKDQESLLLGELLTQAHGLS